MATRASAAFAKNEAQADYDSIKLTVTLPDSPRRKLRILPDTNVVVSAIVWGGVPARFIDRGAVDSREQLDLAPGDFRDWYNHVRPHHHLHGLTPAEAWRGVDPYASAPKSVTYLSAWDGMLTGYHLPH